MNAEFQRIARRDKKAFLSDQCKQIDENNRMGKTRDLFKKIRDTKGTFHAKMGTIRTKMVWTYPDLFGMGYSLGVRIFISSTAFEIFKRCGSPA